jgi:asparagine synthase (glutamine-hydrolysing)
MCGIAGFVNSQGAARREVVDNQLRFLTHRGPDSSGSLASGRGAIGQTRLAIIDLITGNPPIAGEDGTVGVVLNGEIYNYQALRDDLRTNGHLLTTNGDTEVIAHLAEDLAPVEVARALKGMFAFAVWDSARERLILGRDRFGKKPLYYFTGASGIVFASEIKALTAHPAVPADLDVDVIPAYLSFGYVPSPRTFYEGIRSVPPGHVLVVERGELRLDQYWAPSAASVNGVPALDLTPHEAAKEVRRLLAQAVSDRLVSDVPLGAFLSGGLDSSAVVGLMAQATTDPVKTFTIGFDDRSGFDERPWARQVARRFGTEHHEFVVAPNAVDLVERLVWHHDQPFGDSSAVPTYLLAEQTKKEVKVALCGDGGDEAFGGYERFAAGMAAGFYERLPRRVRLGITGLAEAIAPAGSGKLGKAGRFLRSADMGLPHAFRSWVSYVPDDLVLELTTRSSAWGMRRYEDIWAQSAGASVLDRLLLLNLQTYLLDDLLPKVDRMAMAHGLEVRSPFLDHRLVDFSFRLAPSLKVRGFSLKRVLRMAIADLLPTDILRRPKHGFGVPLDRWFREDLANLVAGTLGGTGSRVRRYVNGEAVDRMIAAQRVGSSHGHSLWTLLTLEVFLRQRGW